MAEQRQLAHELLQAQDEAALQRARVAELEARLVVIEKDLVQGKRAQTTRDAPVLAKLDHLISVNERLLQRTPEAPRPLATPALAPAPEPLLSSSAPPPAADDTCGEGLTPEEQLERLVRRLHGHAASGWRGGLSLEQSQALRVLQRRVRELDASSPWQAW